MIIRSLRESKAWTQEELAEKSGLSYRTIQRLEAGSEPSALSLKRLSKTFGIPVDQLRSSSRGEASTDRVIDAQLTKTEHDAVELGHAILRGPKKGEVDPLTALERNALKSLKDLLRR